MATQQEQIEILQEQVQRLTEETRQAYRTWKERDLQLQHAADELRALRRSLKA